MSRLEGIQGIASLPGERGAEAARPQEQGQSLASVLASGPLDVDELLHLAAQVAQTLGAMHRCGVLHLNVNPAHILLHGPQRLPLLIGFQLATTFAQERPGFTHHREIRGNLTYLAPEQTGRTGRSVDLRADLYALGATLYEAATGRPPFEARDPLDLLHDHLVRVPVAPVQLRTELPADLSKIILRLLEKEPERRYQSADGLAYDLGRVRGAWRQGGAPLRLGERDFPLQLSAPSRLVGRNAEIGLLRRALDEAVQGRGGVVLVTGAPGVGKTSLISELRPLVTARRGWFVAGKFDQYRRDAPTATAQAFRALGRLLLAEPKEALADHRERILHALGANAGLMCATPELALLLGPQPEVPVAEPAQAEARLVATALNLLRAIASAERPLVVVLDDLQWADAISVRFVDAVLHADDIPGLLLVGSYRDSEVDAAHPVGASLSRWQRIARSPVVLRLDNLPGEDLQEMLHEMLRMPDSQAAPLARQIAMHTGGNPYDTVELLNALRRDGALRPGVEGWEWDAEALRRYVGQSGVLDLLASRIARLPQRSQELLHILACLGGQVRRSLLCVATGLTTAEIDQRLEASAEDGLLVVEPGDDSALRLRHDRVQQAVYGCLPDDQRLALHLRLARRLAATGQYVNATVEQYLPAVDAIEEAQECRAVARLLRAMATTLRSAANHDILQRLLSAALMLLARLPQPDGDDEALRCELEVELHIALCALGRLEEADALFQSVAARGSPLENWVGAACAQIDSLNSRSRANEGVALGLSLLRQLGLQVP